MVLAVRPRDRADWAIGLAAVWEMIEAAVAQDTHPELGLAFEGSQGDVWDAQHDMLAATCGTAVALLLIASWSRWTDRTQARSDRPDSTVASLALPAVVGRPEDRAVVGPQ